MSLNPRQFASIIPQQSSKLVTPQIRESYPLKQVPAFSYEPSVNRGGIGDMAPDRSEATSSVVNSVQFLGHKNPRYQVPN